MSKRRRAAAGGVVQAETPVVADPPRASRVGAKRAGVVATVTAPTLKRSKDAPRRAVDKAGPALRSRPKTAVTPTLAVASRAVATKRARAKAAAVKPVTGARAAAKQPPAKPAPVPARRPKPAAPPVAQRAGTTRAPAKRPAGKAPLGKAPLGKRVTRFVPPPVRVVKVKSLDPVARCGLGTSVEQLYRVDEQVDGRFTTVHLVFFDKYGWYCVHGRGCTAVADVHQDLRAQRRGVPGPAPTTRAAGR